MNVSSIDRGLGADEGAHQHRFATAGHRQGDPIRAQRCAMSASQWRNIIRAGEERCLFDFYDFCERVDPSALKKPGYPVAHQGRTHSTHWGRNDLLSVYEPDRRHHAGRRGAQGA